MKIHFLVKRHTTSMAALILSLLAFILIGCVKNGDDPEQSATDPMEWNYAKDIDNSTLPGDDFFEYALGSWLKKATIPAGFTSYGIYDETDKQLDLGINKILQSSTDPIILKLRQGVNNEKEKEDNTFALLNKHRKIVQDIQTHEDILRGVGTLFHLGYSPFFKTKFQSSRKTSSIMLTAGFSLYKPAGYGNNKSATNYKNWLIYCFTMLGDDPTIAAVKAANVIKVEQLISNNTNTAANSIQFWKDADNHKYRKSLSSVMTRGTTSDRDILIQGMGLDPQRVTIYESAIDIMDMILNQEIDRESLKNYMESCVIQTNNSAFPLAQRKKMAELLDKKLQSNNELLTELAKSRIIYHISRIYTETYFKPEYKQQATLMAGEMKDVFRQRIQSREWMSDATKSHAIEKIDKMIFCIGYPDTWNPAASPQQLTGNCLAENILQCQANQYKYMISLLAQTPETTSWDVFMNEGPLIMVNALYDPSFNGLYIPVGTLTPPTYNLSVSEAFNYAVLGASTIGHEMTHGFDNNGAKYNSDGELANWWTPADEAAFTQKQDEFTQYFNTLESWPGVPADGRLTLGENIADLGGVEIAYDTFISKKEKEGYFGEAIEDQKRKFYLSYAQAWRTKYGQEYIIAYKGDEHSVPKLRVNGIVPHTNMWYDIFGVKAGEKLYIAPKDRIHIW